MAPSDTKATFFNGQSFTASTPGGTKFKMTFAPDGKMTPDPLAESGSKNRYVEAKCDGLLHDLATREA